MVRMQIEQRKPMARGVDTLMYVGDSDAVEKATTPSNAELGIGAAAAYLALHSQGITRWGAAGLAAWIGYRFWQSRQ